MPAPSTVADFLDVCRKSGVVDENHLSGISGSATATPVAAAKALIRKGILTKFQASQLLAGKYRGLRFDRLKILDKIGSGGMGTVFLCEHLGLRKKVAVKVLPPDQAGDEGVRERFFREARAAAALDHPNIVRVHDMASSGGVHYIVMEYVEGQDLQSVLNKYGALPHGRACNYIAQAALGLQHAHEKGLVHRDIKPANLLVDKEGVVKILDLGLATFAEKKDEQDNLTARFDTGAVLGTADYMAPEQVLNSTAVDIRADIYSLGVTLYALVNGKPPFGGSCTQKLMGHTTIKPTSLTEIRRDIPKGLSVVVDKMMAKNPNERYQTPAEVVEILNPWLEADTIPLDGQQTRKMPGSSRTGKRLGMKKKSKMPLVVAAVAASALVFGGLGAWALSGDSESPKVSASDNPAGVASQNRPPKTGNPPKSNSPATTVPVSKEEARLVYEIDFSKLPAFMATYDKKKCVDMEGSFPDGWTGQSWRAEAKGDVGIRDHNGGRGVAVRTTSGEGGSSELQTVIGASPYRFVAGRRYLLRTEFANVGTQSGRFEVRFDDEHPPVKNSVDLRPTRGEWQTVDLRFTAPPHQQETTYYTHGGVYPDYIVVRSMQVFEYPDAAAPPPAVTGPAQVVYRNDFSAYSPVRIKKKGTETLAETGAVPAGMETFAWDPNTVMEFAIEADGPAKVLALRNLEGRGSVMAFFHEVPGRPGVPYWVTVEYQCAAQTAGKVRILPNNSQVRDVADLPGTNGAWQTARLPFQLNDGEGPGSRIEIHGYSSGTNQPLKVRSVVVTANGPVATAGAANGASLYRLDAAELKPFKRTLTNGQHIASNEAPELPAGTIIGCWKKEDTGEVAVEDVAGRRALSLKNGDGGVSVQFFPAEAIANLKAGEEYILTVSHWGGPACGGRVQLRKPQTSDSFINHELNGTDGKWVVSTARFKAEQDGPVFLYVQDGAGGDAGKVAVGTIELKSAADNKPTPAPAPTVSTGYRLDLSNAKTFAWRYKKDSRTDAQGDGTLPTPWAAHTVEAETVGDVFVDMVGGQPALGLRNNEGPPSVELFCKSGLIEAKAGKKYAVRLTYQTEANAKGGCQVLVNGEEAGGTGFAPSVGGWKETELTVTATADGPLTMTITCGSVGSEASVFVKSIEISEAP
jgi:eukaryotic-like serine/threonine-protein kinase